MYNINNKPSYKLYHKNQNNNKIIRSRNKQNIQKKFNINNKLIIN